MWASGSIAAPEIGEDSICRRRARIIDRVTFTVVVAIALSLRPSLTVTSMWRSTLVGLSLVGLEKVIATSAVWKAAFDQPGALVSTTVVVPPPVAVMPDGSRADVELVAGYGVTDVDRRRLHQRVVGIGDQRVRGGRRCRGVLLGVAGRVVVASVRVVIRAGRRGDLHVVDCKAVVAAPAAFRAEADLRRVAHLGASQRLEESPRGTIAAASIGPEERCDLLRARRSVIPGFDDYVFASLEITNLIVECQRGRRLTGKIDCAANRSLLSIPDPKVKRSLRNRYVSAAGAAVTTCVICLRPFVVRSRFLGYRLLSVSIEVVGGKHVEIGAPRT